MRYRKGRIKVLSIWFNLVHFNIWENYGASLLSSKILTGNYYFGMADIMYYGVSMTLFVTDNDNDGDNWQKDGLYGMEWNVWYDMLCCYLSSDIVVEEEVCIGVDSVLQPPQPVRHLLCLPVQHVDVRHLLRSLPQDRVQTFPVPTSSSTVSNFTILDSSRLAMQRTCYEMRGLGPKLTYSQLTAALAALAWHLHDILLIVADLTPCSHKPSELGLWNLLTRWASGSPHQLLRLTLFIIWTGWPTQANLTTPTKFCQEWSHILVELHTCLKQGGTERLLGGVPKDTLWRMSSQHWHRSDTDRYSRWCLLGWRASTGERGSRDEQPLIQRRAAPLTARNHNSSSLIKCSMLISMLIHQKSKSKSNSQSLIFELLEFMFSVQPAHSKISTGHQYGLHNLAGKFWEEQNPNLFLKVKVWKKRETVVSCNYL